jgi:DNA polymerase I
MPTDYTHPVAGVPRTIRYAADIADLGDFRAWLTEPRRALAFDTETTGLDTFARDHRLRLCQFGDRRTAWVLPVELGPAWAEAARHALRTAPALVAHNAAYDLLQADRHLGVPLEETFPRTTDTYVLSHLIDPRAKSEGGVGHGLKALAAMYVDADAPDTTEGLTAVFRTLRATKATGWGLVPLDHPTFVTYAGLDVLLTAELLEVLAPFVESKGWGRLVAFERRLALLTARMERRGLLVDEHYLRGLKQHLTEEEATWTAAAAQYGVSSVNAPAQVSAALQGMGEKLTDKTATGNLSVGKEVLLPLADLDREWHRIGAREPNPLAEAVLRAKRAGKFRTSYAEAMLDGMDAAGRVHPRINPLRARTARMAISAPPFQQLPSGDWTIRRAIIADPGHLILAVDYAQVEMRVLAALAQERRMTAAVLAGTDLHDNTATLMYGPGFTKPQRRMAKNAGFGAVYGGGAVTLARQTGVELAVAKDARRLFDRAYPGIRRYGRHLQDRAARGDRAVTTPSGRRLPLDGDRLYAATNYVVQSTARDVLAQALLDLEDAGLADFLLLPVHDEVVAQAPAEDAADVAEAIRSVMAMDFFGVPLAAEAEVYGASWGHGYGAPS